MREIRIGQSESGQRLDKFLRRYLPAAGSGFLYKMLRKKNILLDGKKATGSEILQEGAVLRIYFSEDTIRQFRQTVTSESGGSGASLAKSRILYEDEQLLLVNKPAGMLTQKAEASDVSLAERVQTYLAVSGRRSTEDRYLYTPGPANRLDRNTSGIVAVPLTLAAAQQLSVLFRERRIQKRYLALVTGELQTYRELHAWYRRDGSTRRTLLSDEKTPDARPVETHCLPLYTKNGKTLLGVSLVTGRTHQIRSHLQYCGFPIVGDPKYGARENRRSAASGQTVAAGALRRQFLHAWQLAFPACDGVLQHLSGRCFTAPLPADLRQELEADGIPYPDKETEAQVRSMDLRRNGEYS